MSRGIASHCPPDTETAGETGLQADRVLLEKACEAARVGGWQADPETRRVFWTATARRLHEVPEDYLPDLEAALQFYPGEARRTLGRALERLEGEGIACDLELPFRTFAGRRRWVRVTGRARRFAGRCIGLWGLLQDLTATRRLREELDLRGELLDAVGEPLLAADLGGRITYANAAACRALGLPRETLLGRVIADAGPDAAGRIRPAETLEATLRRGEGRGPVLLPGPDGRNVRLDCRTRLIHDGSGRPAGLVCLGAGGPAAPADRPSAPASANGTGAVRTVVVVDDEPGVRKLAGGILGRRGFRVLTAASGGECLELVDGLEGPVQLLLTDVLMPDMNGVELWTALAERFPRIRALFMSGYDASDLAKLGIAVDAHRCLTKPFSIKDLAARVEAALADG